MRVSFFNEKGNLEIRECEGIEADAKQFDFGQSKGHVDVQLMLSTGENIGLRIENEKAYDYLNQIDNAVEKGVFKVGKDDGRVIDRFDKEQNHVYHEKQENELDIELG